VLLDTRRNVVYSAVLARPGDTIKLANHHHQGPAESLAGRDGLGADVAGLFIVGQTALTRERVTAGVVALDKVTVGFRLRSTGSSTASRGARPGHRQADRLQRQRARPAG